jgi:hypothetical protein
VSDSVERSATERRAGGSGDESLDDHHSLCDPAGPSPQRLRQRRAQRGDLNGDIRPPRESFEDLIVRDLDAEGRARDLKVMASSSDSDGVTVVTLP